MFDACCSVLAPYIYHAFCQNISHRNEPTKLHKTYLRNKACEMVVLSVRRQWFLRHDLLYPFF